VSFWRLVGRSARHHWRSGILVVAGCAVATAVIVGSMAVGDSVDRSLAILADQRLGAVGVAVQGRFVDQGLATGLAEELATPAAAVVKLRGVVAAADGSAVSSRVQVLGIDGDLAALLPGAGIPPLDPASVQLNRPLAERLGVVEGDDVVLRVARSSPLPSEAPFARSDVPAAGIRLRVAGVVEAADGGRFHLHNEQRHPLTAFVSRDTLQQRIGRMGEANLLLLGAHPSVTADRVAAAVKARWTLSDAGLAIRPTSGGELQLESEALFLPEEAAPAVLTPAPAPLRIFGYLANEIRFGDRVESYAFVAAVADGAGGSPVAPGLRDDEIALGAWAAEGIGATVGDEVEMAWWQVGDGRSLAEQRRRFTVRAVLPLDGLAADRDLAPVLPGVTAAVTCSDWNPGIPIDLSRISARDEAYWERHGSAPKAFVSWNAGQQMWSNRFGAMTAVRYPAGTEDALLHASVLAPLQPRQVGLIATDARQQAEAAVAQATDFGSLVLGFGFFLLAASLALVALLFALAVERRGETIATLLAVGFPRGRVMRLLAAEGALLAALGSLPGVMLGLAYNAAMVALIEAVWPAAASPGDLQPHVSTATALTGAGAGLLAAIAAILLTAQRSLRATPRDLFADHLARPRKRARGTAGIVAAGAIAAGAVVAIAATSGESPAAMLGAGALVVLAGLLVFWIALSSAPSPATGGDLHTWGLALRNVTRRPGRATAVMAMVSLASFMVVAVEPYRLDPVEDAHIRSSGTGGFALWAETTSAVPTDLGDPANLENLHLDHDIAIVPMRVRSGDDASCLNLSRAQQPRVLGVPTRELHERGAFSFTSAGEGDRGWPALDADPDGAVIPAAADLNTLQWALGLRIGDETTLRDSRGREVPVRIVAALQRSVLQGAILIAERQFLRLYPDSGGYGALLVDAPEGAPDQVARDLSVALRPHGPDIGTTVQRLGAFHAVENTYLSLFQILSGLALLLGSAGLGIVLIHSVIERRGELAMLHAVGFQRAQLRGLLLLEHLGILAAGLAVGLVAAAVATVPHHLAAGRDLPLAPFAATAAAIGLGGCIWVALAATIALRGGLTEILKAER